ncbi:hypothetical protein GGS21DRAFT_533287 [Xylaria nigripes]|nr:hypothetical protein GGS21DRAFT_533287 [Xylaria nigripes]
MESFSKLKKHGADWLHWRPQNMPSIPYMGSGGSHAMRGTWQHVPLPPLPRSSHSLNIVAGHAYIFGGEFEARRPVDNDMHIIVLPCSGAPADYYAVKAKPSSAISADAKQAITSVSEADEAEMALKDPLSEIPLSSSPPVSTPLSSPTSDKGKAAEAAEVPCSRVGHATAVIGSRIFLFGGRSGFASAATLEEKGRVWIFETKTQTWTYLDPHPSSPIPPARSYHSAVATDKPRNFSTFKPGHLRRSSTWKEWAEGNSAEVGIPQRPIAGTIAETATDDEAAGAGFGTFIIHAGCLADGGTRTSDLWAFDVHARTWKRLPDAPGPARGGTALALAQGRIYRFGGFDGKTPLGGQIDVLHLALDEVNDQVSKGEIGISVRGTWESIVAPSSEGTETTGLVSTPEPWPAPRSVCTLSVVHGLDRREYLILMAGESAPSAKGHAGAGKFHSDVWAFQVPPLATTAVSLTDALLHTVGRKTREGWSPISLGPFDGEDEIDVQGPVPRGWFAAASLGDLEENAVFVAGGLDESGERCGDGWVFRLA